MSSFEEIKTLLKEKSGKKLTTVSLITFLMITAIVFFAAFRLCEITRLKQLDGYLGEIPGVIESRSNERDISRRVYEDDLRIREELGMSLSQELHDAEGQDQTGGDASGDWAGVFERVLSGEEVVAFARTGHGLTAYPGRSHGSTMSCLMFSGMATAGSSH